MKVVAAWSGGKDSCFAYYKAAKEGLDVISLLTFMQNKEASNFHDIPVALLDAQAFALGLPLVKQVTEPNLYEQRFKEVLLKFKAQGVQGLVTGDIYEVANHEEGWLERVCKEVGIVPIRPLWQGNTIQIFKDFINAGFKSTVVRTKLDILDSKWIGRELNESFLEDILKLKNVDPCGEGGEYHTIVTDGPNFNNCIKLIETQISVYGGYGHLDIHKFDSMLKE